MRLQKTIVGLALLFAMLMTTTAFATPVSFNLASIGNASIRFSSGSFTFLDSTQSGSLGKDFAIQGGPLSGLLGNIEGSFTIGTVSIVGGTQTAPVTGIGTFSVFDGSSTLTANFQWLDIFTFASAAGLNTASAVNMTNFSYSGTNTELLSLGANPDRAIILQFGFLNTLQTVTSLKSASSITSSYAGDVTSDVNSTTAVPEPGSLLLIGSGLLSLVAITRRKSA